MNWKSRLFWIAAVGTVINVAGVGYAAYTGESMHAMVHSAFAVGFGLWAAFLRQGDRNQRLAEEPRDDRVEALEDEVIDLHRQLTQTQQGLTFAEQLLSQRQPDTVDPARYAPKPDEPRKRELDDDSDINS